MRFAEALSMYTHKWREKDVHKRVSGDARNYKNVYDILKQAPQFAPLYYNCHKKKLCNIILLASNKNESVTVKKNDVCDTEIIGKM